MDKNKINKNIGYEELSELLQPYFDNGDTISAMEYCKELARQDNPFGYLFMGFVYEEGHGPVAINLRKALYCYQKAQRLGADAAQDIFRVKKKKRII
ncbi:MAG: hypothetical protein IKK96_07430 [Lachnospiraceae bacterium]|nr:hypothetical protein [Lachnospiraceae bacterium]